MQYKGYRKKSKVEQISSETERRVNVRIAKEGAIEHG